MSNFKKHLQSISIRYGLVLFALLMIYFFSMNALGLGHNYWLRALNFIFLFFTLRAAILKFKGVSQRNFYEDFFDFYKIGLSTAVTGIGMFAIFIAIYLDVINPQFLEEMKSIEKLSPYLNSVSAAVILFVEGVGSAFICTYLIISIQKSRTVEKPQESA